MASKKMREFLHFRKWEKRNRGLKCPNTLNLYITHGDAIPNMIVVFIVVSWFQRTPLISTSPAIFANIKTDTFQKIFEYYVPLKLSWYLFNFVTLKCSAYWRAAFKRGKRLFKNKKSYWIEFLHFVIISFQMAIINHHCDVKSCVI